MNSHNDITIQNYFPRHFIHPDNEDIYHAKWISEWTDFLFSFKGKPDVIGIEIGTNYGGCSTWLLENVLTGKDSHLYTIDANTNQYIENNLKPYNNVTFIKNLSENALKNLSHKGKTKLFADFIYIDGNHFAKYVLEDAVFSWQLLKYNGYLIFDDYGWGVHTDDESVKPKMGIDAFLHGYKNHYKIHKFGWQIYLEKINYYYPHSEIMGNGNFNKDYE
jgi:cephalosporin hydroxylase